MFFFVRRKYLEKKNKEKKTKFRFTALNLNQCDRSDRQNEFKKATKMKGNQLK